MTEKTFDTIISVLINEKINAEKCNKHGINNAFIENINFALEELKKMNPNNNVEKLNQKMQTKTMLQKKLLNILENMESRKGR